MGSIFLIFVGLSIFGCTAVSTDYCFEIVSKPYSHF